MAKILIIDDDPVFSDMTDQRLQLAGHQVEVHLGPFGATAAANRSDIDLIILDVFMPALPGPELLEIMRQKNTRSRALVMFYSSMDPDELAQLAISRGADGWSSKALGRDAFLAAVEDTLKLTPRFVPPRKGGV